MLASSPHRFISPSITAILDLARSDLAGLVNLGGAPTTMLEYARRTRPAARAVRLADLPGPIPRDSTLALDRLKLFLRDRDEGRE